MQHILSKMRKAIEDYNMIDEGDKIAVCLSGGKDSITMLNGLKALQRFYPKKFDVVAITVDLDFGIQDFSKIEKYCNDMDIEYYVVKTEIANVVFNERQESNPCSLCAKMRKGALNDFAKSIGCNKIAYAHHKDDMIETMYKFNGVGLSAVQVGILKRVVVIDKMELTFIRPLMYVPEADVIGFTNKYELPVAKSKCPVDGHTKREYVKNMVKQLNKENPGCKERFFRAVLNKGFD